MAEGAKRESGVTPEGPASAGPRQPLPDRRYPLRLAPDAYRQPNQVVFITTCTKHRRPILTVGAVPGLLVAAIRDCAEACRVHLVGYCLMPDHVHLVVATGTDCQLPEYVRRVKGRSSRELRLSGVDGAVWEKSYWDRHARDWESAEAMVAYVLHNPVRKGLCATAEEWPHAGFLGFPWSPSGPAEAGPSWDERGPDRAGPS